MAYRSVKANAITGTSVAVGKPQKNSSSQGVSTSQKMRISDTTIRFWWMPFFILSSKEAPRQFSVLETEHSCSAGPGVGRRRSAADLRRHRISRQGGATRPLCRRCPSAQGAVADTRGRGTVLSDGGRSRRASGGDVGVLVVDRG